MYFARVVFIPLIFLLIFTAACRLRDPSDLVPVTVDGKLLYIDANAHVILSLPYRYGRRFSEGLASVDIEHGCGYIDSSGRLVVPGKFDRCDDFSDGYALVVNEGATYGYIDRTGKIQISAVLQMPADWHMIPLRFYDDRALAKFGNKWGFIDRAGKKVAQFDSARRFSEGLAAVQVDHKWGFANTEGHLRIQPIYEQALEFSEGLAAVKIGSKWGYIDRKGVLTVAAQFDEAKEFHEGMAAIRAVGAWAFINRGGTRVFELKNAVFVQDFCEGAAVVALKDPSSKEALWAYRFLNKTGAWALPGEFRDATDFRGGLATVRDEYYGRVIIDKAGKYVWRDIDHSDSRDVISQIKLSNDIKWLKYLASSVENAAGAVASEGSHRFTSAKRIRTAAYCRLYWLGDAESINAAREIEARQRKVPLTSPWSSVKGIVRHPAFSFGDPEIWAVAITNDGHITYALIASHHFSGYDLFLTFSRTPRDTGSWTRPKLIPNGLYFGIQEPKLTLIAPGKLKFSFIYNALNGAVDPRVRAPISGPQEWILSINEIEKDSDRDGWTDFEETRLGLDPANADTDGDGLPDGKDVCPNYAPPQRDSNDEEVQILQKAFFAVCGLSQSRYVLFADPTLRYSANSVMRSVQLWGYAGPVIYGVSRSAWMKTHFGALFVSWSILQKASDKAVVVFELWEGPDASESEELVLRKVGDEWFPVDWIEGSVS